MYSAIYYGLFDKVSKRFVGNLIPFVSRETSLRYFRTFHQNDPVVNQFPQDFEFRAVCATLEDEPDRVIILSDSSLDITSLDLSQVAN